MFESVDFAVHNRGDSLADELGIKTYPSFVVNNKIKFSGVLSSETIKDNFCKFNINDRCSQSLTKKLI
jgi:predicted DsbA family dithiol-disulfide isomerase